jgi:hypothetical protein
VSRRFDVPRCRRSRLRSILPLAGLAATVVLASAPACAQQGNSSQSSLLSPDLDGSPPISPRFRAVQNPTPSGPARFGQLPTFSYQQGIGIGSTGFDSSNGAKRKAKASKAKPGAKPPSPAAASNTQPQPNAGTTTTSPTAGANTASASDPPPTPKLLQPPVAPLPGRLRNAFRPGAPPANPDDPTPTVATALPYYRPLPEERPFDPTGVQVGAFNFRPAIAYARGYDTNPARIGTGPTSSSWFNLYAPELRVDSNWDRHALTASFFGTYATYDTYHSLDRPTADGRINGRIDVTRDSRIDLEGRFLLGTDRPGSPNIQADLAHLPIYTTIGGSTGFTERFNRLELTVKGGVDRTEYQRSEFVNGQTESNDDRNYNQYGGQFRVGYEILPGIRPFVEVGAYHRVHDLSFDRFEFERDSNGWTARAGTSVNLVRTLTGEIAVGYLTQTFEDPRLQKVGGLAVDGALVWSATALTTARLIATTTINESPLSGVSGTFTRQIGLQVEHAFRRWLIATAGFTYARDVYVGDIRADNRYIASIAMTYILSRELQLRAEFREEWQHSNIPGSNYAASIWLMGVRLQR